MRARLAVALSLSLIFSLLALQPAAAATVTLAQEADTSEDGAVSGEDEAQGSESGNEEDGVGQSDADAESGAGQEEQLGGEESVEEEGPPWTYQMARIGIVLMLLIGLALGLLYYRMIASRQRAA